MLNQLRITAREKQPSSNAILRVQHLLRQGIEILTNDRHNAERVKPRGPMSLYTMKDCGSNLVARVKNSTRCEDLSGWVESFKLGDQCFNTGHKPAKSVCRRFSALRENRQLIRTFSDGHCRQLLGVIGELGVCEADRFQYVRSVEIGGSCQQIWDTSEASACKRFRAGLSLLPKISLYYGRTCSTLGAIIDTKTQCDSLGNSQVHSIRFENGECEDIHWMSMKKACERFGP